MFYARDLLHIFCKKWRKSLVSTACLMSLALRKENLIHLNLFCIGGEIEKEWVYSTLLRKVN